MIDARLFEGCSVLVVDDQSTSRTILSHVVKSINAKIKIIEKPLSIDKILLNMNVN